MSPSCGEKRNHVLEAHRAAKGQIQIVAATSPPLTCWTSSSSDGGAYVVGPVFFDASARAGFTAVSMAAKVFGNKELGPAPTVQRRSMETTCEGRRCRLKAEPAGESDRLDEEDVVQPTAVLADTWLRVEESTCWTAGNAQHPALQRRTVHVHDDDDAGKYEENRTLS